MVNLTRDGKHNLRVMFFETGEFGGSVVCLAEMINGLTPLGCEVGLVSYYKNTGPTDLRSMDCLRFWRCLDVTPKVRPQPEVAVRTIGIPRPTSFGVRYFFLALRALRRFQPNIAYFNTGIESSIPAAIAAKLLGIPTVSHLRIARDLYPIERIFVPIFDQFIALTKAGQQIAQASGTPEYKLTQIYDPFDVSAFVKQMKEPLSENIAWDKDCVYVVQVGALISRKRPMLALNAFALARAQCPNLRLIFAGSGPLRDQLERAVARRGLEGSVHLIGNCMQIPALLSHCDIGLFVSGREGLGLALLEYMAAGLPVVTWSMPVFDELIVNGETGLLVQKDDSKSFAEALVRLCRSSELRKQMGQAGRKWVAEGQFDTSRYMRYMHSLLLNVANGASPKRFSAVMV